MRILLLRTSALGDVVHALPVLTELRRRFPAARLGWVIEAGLAPLLDGHPDLDQVIEIRSRDWRRRPLAGATRRAVGELLAALDRFAPDVVLDLMGNHKAGVLAALTGCDRHIGFARADRREPSSALWASETVAVHSRHAVDRGLELLTALDLQPGPVDFAPDKLLRAVPEGARSWLAARSGPAVFVHPGAAWANKRYPPQLWAATARGIAARTGAAVWVGAAPGEEPLAAEIVAASGGAAELAPAPTLAHLAALLRRCALVLGGDTGPLHLARALGVEVLCLMGPTDPERHGPHARPDSVLFVRLPCSFCHRRLEETKACLLALSPATVVDRAVAVLAAANLGARAV